MNRDFPTLVPPKHKYQIETTKTLPDRKRAHNWKRRGHTCMLGHLNLSGFFLITADYPLPKNKYYVKSQKSERFSEKLLHSPYS
ncbi:MAG: hypothetical protein ACI8ZM_004727 [Crocinitomix sp.]|jgi:hypothetical protein